MAGVESASEFAALAVVAPGRVYMQQLTLSPLMFGSTPRVTPTAHGPNTHELAAVAIARLIRRLCNQMEVLLPPSFCTLAV